MVPEPETGRKGLRSIRNKSFLKNIQLKTILLTIGIPWDPPLDSPIEVFQNTFSRHFHLAFIFKVKIAKIFRNHYFKKGIKTFPPQRGFSTRAVALYLFWNKV